MPVRLYVPASVTGLGGPQNLWQCWWLDPGKGQKAFFTPAVLSVNSSCWATQELHLCSAWNLSLLASCLNPISQRLRNAGGRLAEGAIHPHVAFSEDTMSAAWLLLCCTSPSSEAHNVSIASIMAM